MALLLSNNFEIPLPDLSGDRFADRAQDAKVSELATNMLVTSTLQQSQSGGSNVKLGNVVPLDDVPVSREVGVGRCTLEYNRGYTEHKRSINDIGVTGNPADITTTEVSIALVDIKDILSGHSSAEEVPSGCVQDTLRLASRAGGIKEE